MKSAHTIGLLLICMLSSSTLHASPDDTTEQDYNEYYDDEDYDYSLDNILKETEPTTKTKPPTTTTQKPIRPSTSPDVMKENIPQVSTGLFIELPNKNYQCPQECSCNFDFTLIKCKQNNLNHIPQHLPETVETLDLSSNRISYLDGRDFDSFAHLKELILDSNNLISVNFQNISGLRRLESLSLANNHLTQIEPNAFSRLVALKTLNLSRNLIEISSPTSITTADGEVLTSHSFLNHPNLRELNLNGCKVHGIHENMFKNTSELMALDLGNNEFNEPIDIQAFVPLKNLVKLKLPELKQSIITQLCKTLTVIDAISLPAYDVSCFELESGSSFDDSTIRTRPLVGTGIDANTLNGSGENDSSGVSKTFASRNEPSGVDRTGEKSINAVEVEYTTRRSRPSAMEPSRSNRTQSEIIVNSTAPSIDQHTGEPEDEGDYKVSISSQTINQILIGIIIVAVAGIIIGIICRKDFCGVKTKMCRTRRPPPTDQVRPAEEIPLNKV